MKGKILVDTNVLVYAYDRSEPEKQNKALTVLDYLAVTGTGVISTQIMAEFFVVVTRKIKPTLSAAVAYERLANYHQSWHIIDMTAPIVLETGRGVRDYQFSFWDAQIWATAHLNQISTVFSEDFNVGAVIEGVRFVNPLLPDFAIEDWIFV